jgi:hypothetical protein
MRDFGRAETAACPEVYRGRTRGKTGRFCGSHRSDDSDFARIDSLQAAKSEKTKKFA